MQQHHTHPFSQFLTLPMPSILNEFQLLQNEFYSGKYQKLMYSCQQSEEKGMNRYSNILPYKDNVVKGAGCSYFNASEIKLLSGERVIATQAPVRPFENFWQVVLEENVGLIVMLCALDDPKRGKQADRYWPDAGEKSLKEGGILVTLKSVEILGDKFELREFVVEKGGEEKVVSQLHWHGWKDFGVPTEQSIDIVEKLISRIHRVFEEKRNIVLHCSAGVGRTGTLIAIVDGIGLIDKEMEGEGKQGRISVFEIVANIRRQRFGSVQTEEQYEFVYKFLRRYLESKKKGEGK